MCGKVDQGSHTSRPLVFSPSGHPVTQPQRPRSQDHQSPIWDRGVRPFGASTAWSNLSLGCTRRTQHQEAAARSRGTSAACPTSPKVAWQMPRDRGSPGLTQPPPGSAAVADVLTVAAGTDRTHAEELSHFKATINFLCSLANLFN